MFERVSGFREATVTRPSARPVGPAWSGPHPGRVGSIPGGGGPAGLATRQPVLVQAPQPEEVTDASEAPTFTIAVPVTSPLAGDKVPWWEHLEVVTRNV